MDKNIKKELVTFIPLFAAIVLFAVGLNYIMPEKIPESINLAGTASKIIDKASIKYHIPIPELIVYVFLTFLQFHHIKKNVPLSDFLYYSKLGIIIFTGISIPSSLYLLSIEYLPNAWYFIGPAFGALVIYLFIMVLITGVMNKTKTIKTETAYTKSRKKFKKKKK